jgi:hypothetical protein
VHIKAKIPQTYHAAVERQPDGSFLATVYFQKKGTWSMTIHLVDAQADGATPGVQDTYVSLIKIGK